MIYNEIVGKVDFWRYFNQIQDFNMVVHSDLIIKSSSNISILALTRQSYNIIIKTHKLIIEKISFKYINYKIYAIAHR